MRVIPGILVIGLLSVPSAASAQEWTEFTSKESGFAVNFPGEPRVSQMTFKSEYGYMLPAQVYTAQRGPERYTVTVVDYSGIERSGVARAKGCPAGAEPCVFIAMHLDRLYIFEGTVPAGNPEPGLFQQSVGFLDYNGRRVRYQYVYSNRFAPPPLTGGGGTPALSPSGALPTPR